MSKSHSPKTYDVEFKVENVCTTSLKDLIETILKISENGEITNIAAIVIVKELPKNRA